ncbi:nuclear transport factor 2 family protein [Algoriphagus sp.]|uniref:nuclear transport factor 2 family protein n=1 Tax=Algoriphagus sp. TaxID=1872435 RepID=UPI0026074002|nr:nuclear transport factor 2 family protein [Algoriphagus sp.]
MELIKQFTIAFAGSEVGFIIDSVTDQIVWTSIGKKKIKGKENFAEEVKKMQGEKAMELALDQILSHGKQGAANGTLKMQNGKRYAFSDFYVFQDAKGTKIKSITSYVIEI